MEITTPQLSFLIRPATYTTLGAIAILLLGAFGSIAWFVEVRLMVALLWTGAMLALTFISVAAWCLAALLREQAKTRAEVTALTDAIRSLVEAPRSLVEAPAEGSNGRVGLNPKAIEFGRQISDHLHGQG